MKKTWLNWSSGKDSALALYYLGKDKEFNVGKLFTTLNSDSDRISMHNVRKELLFKQAQSLHLSIQIGDIPTETPVDEYNARMKNEILSLKKEGFTHSAFGDIFLEDLKDFREAQLNEVGIKAVFPLWKKDTSLLINEFIKLGFKAIVICTNSRFLDESFCGRLLDSDFVNDLPDNVDPCGENGEYHTFVFDGPIFKEGIDFQIGEKTTKTYRSDKGNWDNEFCYCDLISY